MGGDCKILESRVDHGWVICLVWALLFTLRRGYVEIKLIMTAGIWVFCVAFTAWRAGLTWTTEMMGG